MVNSVILTGRLTRDPELRYTPSGAPVARFSLAVDRRARSNGEKQTDFIRCSAWNKTAELVTNYLQKGRLVAVEGSLRINSVTNPDGTRREYAEVVCHAVQFLDRAGDQAQSNSAASGAFVDDDDDDMPF